MTYGEQFASAMECQTKEEAGTWLQEEIARYKTDFGIEPEEAKKTILINLGYMAGYYGRKEAAKVRDLFGALHPILGDWADNPPSAQQAFKAGVEAARRTE